MTTNRHSSTALWCFLTLLLWVVCTTVGGLVNKELEAPQSTTAGHTLAQASNDSDDFSSGNYTSMNGCGNVSDHCGDFCEFCVHFQLAPMDCLDKMYKPLCLDSFNNYMDSQSDHCLWSNVRSAYNNVTICTEEIAECLQIPWPNPLVEQTFVNIHTKFFKDCPSEELSDPPPGIMFALVMTPICLIPVMVVLVVLKTKNGDGSS